VPIHRAPDMFCGLSPVLEMSRERKSTGSGVLLVWTGLVSYSGCLTDSARPTTTEWHAMPRHTRLTPRTEGLLPLVAHRGMKISINDDQFRRNALPVRAWSISAPPLTIDAAVAPRLAARTHVVNDA